MDEEIDLLVNHFRQLWKNGRSAHLDLDCHAGQAWMGLRVRLGQAHGQQDHHPGVRTRNSPSRQRRRMRRAAARQQAAENAAATALEAEKVTRESVHKHESDVTEEVTKTKTEDIDTFEHGNPQFVKDEIDITEISVDIEKECAVDELIKIEGEFKNPKFKPWTKINPVEEVNQMWDIIKNESNKKGIEEIGEASATLEHCFGFWGTWKVKKPGLILNHLKNSKNWPKGIKITKVTQA